MSERGMILALQRIHDDPGFTDRVNEDPQNTLGIYDLDQEECDRLINAVTNRDNRAIRQMASGVGIDWRADHIGGVGALDEQEVSTEGAVNTGIKGPGALPGDGYEGVMPERPA
jgi:hypothetical protein